MEGKLKYVLALSVEDEIGSKVLSRTGELTDWNSTQIRFWARLLNATLQQDIYNLRIDEFLQIKLAILGKRVPDTKRLVVEFKSAMAVVYKVMVSPLDRVLVRQRVWETGRQLCWHCDPEPVSGESREQYLMPAERPI
jgi:hypothetical protein